MTADQLEGEPPSAQRTALERAFLEIARKRYPGRIWTVDRDSPPETPQPDTSTTDAKMKGSMSIRSRRQQDVHNASDSPPAALAGRQG